MMWEHGTFLTFRFLYVGEVFICFVVLILIHLLSLRISSCRTQHGYSCLEKVAGISSTNEANHTLSCPFRSGTDCSVLLYSGFLCTTFYFKSLCFILMYVPKFSIFALQHRRYLLIVTISSSSVKSLSWSIDSVLLCRSRPLLELLVLIDSQLRHLMFLRSQEKE